MNQSSSDLKNQFKYYGEAGIDYPRFDGRKRLPLEVEPTPRYKAHLGLQVLPVNFSFLDFIFSRFGFRSMAGSQLQEWMPANLSRLHFDKFSNEYFVERRLNGFNPGKLKPIEGKDWQYAVKYDTSRYKVEAGGLLPEYCEARFILIGQTLKVHSIEYCLKDQVIKCFPPDGEEWELAKYYFRNAEFIFQEIQSHLGRTHMNMDQYAMAFYRNILNNPIRELLLPHFEGLINIDKKGALLIIGTKGFIPEASALDYESVEKVLTEEISTLSYKWSPINQLLPDVIENNYFDKAAKAMWELLEKYVSDFFVNQENDIKSCWAEIEAMSEDLSSHSILKPEFGILEVKDIENLKQLCIYIIYHCTFFHSWVNNKQYEDGGDVKYTSIGLWDKKDVNYDPKRDDKKVLSRNDSQVKLMWTLANVRYNPAIELAPLPLKKLLWEYRDRIESGIPLGSIMMSINI